MASNSPQQGIKIYAATHMHTRVHAIVYRATLKGNQQFSTAGLCPQT